MSLVMVWAIAIDVGGITADARTADKFLNDRMRGGNGVSVTIGAAMFETIGTVDSA